MKRRLLCACQVAAVSEAGRAYVWACAAEEDGRVSGTLTATVDVAGAAPSQTCACSPWQADKQFSMPTSWPDTMLVPWTWAERTGRACCGKSRDPELLHP